MLVVSVKLLGSCIEGLKLVQFINSDTIIGETYVIDPKYFRFITYFPVIPFGKVIVSELTVIPIGSMFFVNPYKKVLFN